MIQEKPGMRESFINIVVLVRYMGNSLRKGAVGPGPHRE